MEPSLTATAKDRSQLMSISPYIYHVAVIDNYQNSDDT